MLWLCSAKLKNCARNSSARPIRTAPRQSFGVNPRIFSGNTRIQQENKGKATGSQYWYLKWLKTVTYRLSGINQVRMRTFSKRALLAAIPYTHIPRLASRKSALPKFSFITGQAAEMPLA